MSSAEVLLQRGLTRVAVAGVVFLTGCAGGTGTEVRSVPAVTDAPSKKESALVRLAPSALPPTEPSLSLWYPSVQQNRLERVQSQQSPLAVASVKRKKVSYRNDRALVIGLLLPQTRYRGLAKKMENSARFALSELDTNARFSSVRLLVRDSSPPSAAQDLFSSGADVVLGPVLAKNSHPAAEAATRAKRILITFSNDAEIKGAFTYRFGLSPEQQTEAWLQYALSVDEDPKIAIVAPQSKYGRLVVASALESLKQHGLRAERIDFLDPALEYDQLDGQIRHIADYDYRQLALQAERRKLLLQRNKLVEDSPKAIAIQTQLDKLKKKQTFGPPPFNILLLAEARQETLQVVSSYFALYDVDPQNVAIYGLAPWGQMRKLQREPQLHKSRYVFVPQATMAAFVNKLLEHETSKGKNRTPHMLEALVYDAIKTVALLGARQGFVTRQQLEDGRGFLGASGRFRFYADGEVQRLYEIREITRQGSKQLASAARQWPLRAQ